MINGGIDQYIQAVESLMQWFSMLKHSGMQTVEAPIPAFVIHPTILVGL